jgi:hypothetical protein
LGKADGKVVSTPDEALYNGFYNVKNDAYKGDETTTDWRLGWCSLLVERKEGRICQTAKSADLTWYRTSADGGITWEPWEWVNPLMEIGIEYRTTERWMGKPVYTTLVDCGVCEGENKDVTTEFSALHIIRHCGHIGGYSLPMINFTLDNEHSAWANVTDSNGYLRVSLFYGSGLVGNSAYVQAWYTKP